VQNIELKARLTDLDRARRIAAKLATKRLEPQHQIDTYFHCRSGRLKLRQIDGLTTQLIWYERPDREGPKASDYRLVPVANPETLKAALSGALGVRTVVEKRREIFLWHNVRIHLDEVTGLGAFLEFEAVLGPEVEAAAGHAQVEDLIGRFGIAPSDLLSGSYGEMASP
jgi:predicted adenylyl cyclase CyaB